MSDKPSEAAKAFVEENSKYPMLAARTAALFDKHLARALQQERDTKERLLHELGIPDATIEQASDRIGELRAEARRSADLAERLRQVKAEHAEYRGAQ